MCEQKNQRPLRQLSPLQAPSNSTVSSQSLTFAFKKVERTEKSSISTCWGLGTVLAQKLSELCPRKVNKASDVTEHQFQENIWVLVAEFLHKKIRVEDDWWSASARVSRRFLVVDHHAVHCTGGGDA